LEQRIDEGINWQLGDMWWNINMLTQAIRSRAWGDDFLREQLGPQPGC